MASVDMQAVSKRFGESIALEGFTIHIDSGELICLLGPSGCGKTTALRILAGFERADSGTVTVDDQDITRVAVEKRNFGMVFQDYSLFPNMTTLQNIEFGLKAHKVSGAQRAASVQRLLGMTDLEDQAHKYPHQMSGGQKQRVALARAIATSPRVLLLDEPLSALDAKVRQSLREEIRHLQKEIGVTTVFVTHDQQEALAIADRVGVMSKGRLEQLATPRELYENPKNAFVATFIGSMNRISATGTATGSWQVLDRELPGNQPSMGNQQAVVGVRPEDLVVRISDTGSAQIVDASFLGPITRVSLVMGSQTVIVADVMSAESGDLRPGMRALVGIRPDVKSVVVMAS